MLHTVGFVMSTSADQRTLRYYNICLSVVVTWQQTGTVLLFVVGVFTVVVLDRKSEQRRLQHTVQYSHGHYFYYYYYYYLLYNTGGNRM